MSIIISSFEETLVLLETPEVTNGKTLPYYGSLDDANNYFAYKLDNDVWLVATTTQKIAALVESTRAIDNLNFVGTRPDDQALEFPREEIIDIVPIQQACYECALALLGGVNTGTETDNLRMTSRAYAGLRTTFDNSAGQHTVHGIASANAWRMLKPYLRDASSITLKRV